MVLICTGSLFIGAARDGRRELVAWLWHNGHVADVDSATDNGLTALGGALQQGHVDVTEFLVTCGASIDRTHGHAVAIQASQTGDHEPLDELLKELDEMHAPEMKRAVVNTPLRELKLTPLHLAVQHGHAKVVEVLLRHRADIERKNGDGYAPLHAAVENGQEEVVQLLLDRGADKETTAGNGFTPLMVGTRKGVESIVRLLLLRGANVNHTTAKGFSALQIAVVNGLATITKLLLQHGAHPDAWYKLGATPLLAAAEMGNLDLVRCLIDHGANIDAKDMDHATPVTMAVERGHTEVCALLLENGASTEVCTLDGLSPLHRAAKKGNVRMIDLLCQFKADANLHGPMGKTALHLALESTSGAAVQRLLDHGASVTSVDDDGLSVLLQACLKGNENVVNQITRRLDHTGEIDLKRELVNKALPVDKWAPLHAAADLGDLSLVKLLVGHGAEVDSKNCNGFTPLHLAATKGFKKVVQFLLESGADQEATNGRDATTLMIAANRGFKPIVDLLLERNANVHHRGIIGNTALFDAAMWGRVKIVEVLVDKTADPDARSSAGWTPLLVAAQVGHTDVVRFLIGKGVNINAQADDHWTPLTIAARNGHKTVCELLLNEGALQELRTTDGQTALHLAASSDHRMVIRLLLSRGSDRSSRDFHGRTAADVAMMHGYFEAAMALATATESDGNEDSIWSRSSLFELYGVSKPRERLTSGSKRDPAWYIDRASVSAIEEYAALTTIATQASIGTWIGARVVIVEPTIIAFFKPVDAKMHVGLKRVFRNDISKLYPLRHPHVIRLYGASHRDTNLYLVMEHPQDGSFRSFVSTNSHRTWAILHQVALGLRYLHERGIVHGKIAGDNILVGDDGLIKLAGFGAYTMSLNSVLNRVYNAPQTTNPDSPLFDRRLHEHAKRLIKKLSEILPHARSLKTNSTNVWEAPEVVLGETAKFESDIYSLGMCIIEAVSGELPYALEESLKQDVKKDLIIGGIAPRKPERFSSFGWELVLKMICFEPSKRLKISEVVRELEALANNEAMETNNQRMLSAGKSRPGDDFLAADNSARLNGCDHDIGDHDDESLEHHVLHRLLRVWQAADKLPQMSRQEVRARLQSVHARLTSDRKASEHTGNAASFAAQRQLADRTFSLHNEIDRLLDHYVELFPVTTTVHSWREQWIACRTQQLHSIGAMLERVTELDEETATCLLFELTRRRDAYTSIEPAKIHEACCTLRAMPGVHLPDWFIPDYEVQFDDADSFSFGGFATVHHGKWMDTPVVIKKLYESSDDGAAFEKEVETWSYLYHPHVLQLFGACHVGQRFIVSEFAEGRQLDKYLLGLKKQPAKHRRELWRTLSEAALGLLYLHARGVVHCDLKCDNILVGRDGKTKVSDYGLSQRNHQSEELHDAERQAHTLSAVKQPKKVGARQWKAPEVLNGAGPTVESDVYSFGMCIVEAVTGEYPWGKEDVDNVCRHVRTGGDLFKKPATFSNTEWELVVGACHFDPKRRLSLSAMVEQLQTFAKQASETSASTPLNELECLMESKSDIGPGSSDYSTSNSSDDQRESSLTSSDW